MECNNAGCSYEKTFSRQWELQRHIAAKHRSEKPFWCSVVGCIKGRAAPAFARPDELTAHIRAVHHRGKVYAVCPASNCANTALELDLLGVHIRIQHLKNGSKHEGVIGGLLRAMNNAASTDYRHCPLWFCKLRVGLDDFPLHLLSHTSEELDAAVPVLAQEGYIVSKSGCEHDNGGKGSANQCCTCKVTSVELACPLCLTRRGSRQSLKSHIEERHVQPGVATSTSVFRQRILALIRTDAVRILGDEIWSDVACQLRTQEEKAAKRWREMNAT